MNTYLTVALCLCALVVLADGVVVTVEDFSFPWESVRKLKEFQDTMPIRNPRLRSSRRTPECATHGLPEEFIPVCKSPKAANIFERLASIAAEQRVCEICANVACSGC